MKVGTDGVLLGAWTDVSEVEKVLDIGTGSGLIALMIAQRCNASVTAVDIDEGAYIQGRENFERSPWKDRLEVYHRSLQDFSENYSGKKFDLIVSNPPYFEQSYKPHKEDRALARHSDKLGLEELIRYSSNLLSENGKLCLILPSELQKKLEETAREHSLVISRLTVVYPKPGKPAKRCLIQLERNIEKMLEGELTIEEGERHQYSNAFKEMVKDFYLHM